MRMRVNGRADACITANDRGLAYGDGVFRTLACVGGRLWSWRRHYAKLCADCAALALKCPPEADWLADIALLAPVDAVVKLTVTRGEGVRGYAFDASSPETRIVQVSALPGYDPTLFEQGAGLRLCAWPLSIQPGLAGVKHLNRLDQVMARREWSEPDIFDGLMFNARGELVEGVVSNLFLLRQRTLLTHALTDCGVAGVARAMVLDLARSHGWSLELGAPSLDHLDTADEVFVCNSLAGIVPVRQIESRHWSQFPRTIELQRLWIELAHKESRPWSTC